MDKKDLDLVQKVLQNTRERHLLDPGAKVVVAVSGGADSIALLNILHELAGKLDLELIVAHLNHHIRGKEADNDEEFVREKAREMALPTVTGSSFVRRIASRHGISLEMAARKARYRFLGRTVRDTDSSCAALAHTADDQVENVILKLSRGSGLRGLSGMDWKSLPAGFPVIRPLLNVHKDELIGFLRRRQLQWREDASNKDLDMLRNTVRHEIIPILESRLNPSFRETVRRNLDILREEDRWLQNLAARLLSRCSQNDKNDRIALNVAKMQSLSPAELRRVIQLWVMQSGTSPEGTDSVTTERIEKLIRQQRGTGYVPLPKNFCVRRTYDRLLIDKSPSASKRSETHRAGRGAVTLNIPGEVTMPQTRLKVTAHTGPGLSLDKTREIGSPPASATISLRKLGERKLTVRTWRKGDRISPTGMSGSKKLQDIFVDNKVPPEERKTIPLVVCEDQVVWLPGYSVARNWSVEDSSRPNIQLRLLNP